MPPQNASPWARPRARARDLGPAALIGIGLLATALVPQAVGQAYGNPTEQVPQGRTETLRKDGAAVEFSAPAGWTKALETSPQTATYTRDGMTVGVTMSGGVRDAANARHRAVETLSRDGYPSSRTGQRLSTPAGLEGEACTTVDSPDRGAGRCAVLTQGSVVVTAVSVARAGEEPADLGPLLDSLRVQQPKATLAQTPSTTQQASLPQEEK